MPRRLSPALAGESEVLIRRALSCQRSLPLEMAGTEAPAQADAAEAAALAERRAAIDEKLAATEQARQEAVDRRRQVAELQRDEAEDVDKFLGAFEAEVGVGLQFNVA